MVVMSPIFLNGVPEPGILPLSGKMNFRPLTSTSFIGTPGNLAVMFGVSSRTGMSWLPRNLFQRSKDRVQPDHPAEFKQEWGWHQEATLADQSKKLREFNEKTKMSRVQKNDAALRRFFNDAVSAKAQRFCDPAESSSVADSGKQLQRQHRDLRRPASPRYS